MTFDSILMVGCGNMAGAMLDGWLAAGLDPGRFTVVDPAPRALPAGVRKLDALPEGEAFAVVLLGIKPQLLATVAPQVAPLAGPDTWLASILAGVELAVLRASFPRAGALLRIMPNLSAALGKSPVALAAEGLDATGRAAAIELFAPLGSPEWIAESDFDLVTALAGSGPAFVYRFIDALAKAAEAGGLTARGWTRTLRLARTIADLESAGPVRRVHVAEALVYRRAGQTAMA